MKANSRLQSVDINLNSSSNNSSKLLKQSNNSISTSDKDTTSSYSSLSYNNSNNKIQKSNNNNNSHNNIIKKTCFNKAASYPIRKINTNNINKNNNSNNSVELISVYSKTPATPDINSNKNKENFLTKNISEITGRRNSSTKSKNSSISNKRNAKSLDDFLWPWKRFHKSDSTTSKKKQENSTVVETEVNEAKNFKTNSQTEDEEEEFEKEFQEGLSNIKDSIEIENTLSSITSNKKKTSKFQLFNNNYNNKLSSFIASLFHKKTQTASVAAVSSLSSSSSTSSFTLLTINNKPSSIPITTSFPSSQQQQQQQQQSDNSFKIINENGDQISMSTCTTYVNPYLENNKQKSLSLSEQSSVNEVKQSLETSFVIKNKNKEEKIAKSMFSENKSTSSSSNNSVTDNNGTSKSLIKYCSRLKNQHDNKTINYFKRSASMVESTKITQNNNNNDDDNQNQVFNNSTNEYSEPFDVISDSSYSTFTNASSSNHENICIVLKSEPKPYYLTLSQQSILTSDDSKNSLSKSTGYSTCSLNKIADTTSELNDLESDCNKFVINSDYDTVNDCLYKQAIERGKVTAYDILNERKPELIKHLNANKMSVKSDADVTKNEDISLDTIFLERVLTFQQKHKESALISVKKYVYDLAASSDDDTDGNDCIFSKSINEFIKCINSSIEANPYAIMSNVRQFLNGMKNYLIKNSSERFLTLIDAIRQNLNSTQQVFNIDSLIEDCLENIVLIKLKHKIYYLLVDWLINNNMLCAFSSNIKDLLNLDKILCTKLLGVKVTLDPSMLKILRGYYICMQNEYSPFAKIKYILFIINELLLKIKKYNSALYDLCNLDLSEFLPLIIYILCVCNMYSMQIEIDYIWGLVHRQSINTETIFYLTLMSSACHILKTLNIKQLANNFDVLTNNSSVVDLSYLSNGLFNFVMPNEKSRTIENFYIPIKQTFKCKEICNIIAFMLKIFNSNDYSLYLLDENGAEKKIRDDEQPFEIKIEKFRLNLKVAFIYKNKCANIVWPKTIFFD